MTDKIVPAQQEKSAPVPCSSQNSAERDPSVMPDQAGADTGVLRYAIRQQDDSIVEMTCADTFENRLFVRWVKSYEAAQDQFHGLTPGIAP